MGRIKEVFTMKYLSIDIETTGLDPERHQILEFAAIFEDSEKQLSFEELPKFHAYFSYNELIGEPYALQLNQDILRIISGLLELPEEAKIYHRIMDEFNPFEDHFFIWITELFGEENATVAGNNFGQFDYQFLRRNFPSLVDCFYHRFLDPGSMLVGYDSDRIPNLEQCLEMCEMEPTNLHTAIGDAWDVIRLIRYKWNNDRDIYYDRRYINES